MSETTDNLIEFLPLIGAIAIFILVPVLELSFRRFLFPFVWATMGFVAVRPLTTWAMQTFDIHGLKAETLMIFQGATLAMVVAILIGEWARGARVLWRPLLATLGIISVPMMMLASHLLQGGGPRVFNLGEVLVWVSVAGYFAGPASLAALVYVLGVHRIELYEELGH